MDNLAWAVGHDGSTSMRIFRHANDDSRLFTTIVVLLKGSPCFSLGIVSPQRTASKGHTIIQA